MPYDKDLRDLMKATAKSSRSLKDGIEREMEKAKIRRDAIAASSAELGAKLDERIATSSDIIAESRDLIERFRDSGAGNSAPAK